MSKAVLIVLSSGLISGLAHFALAGSRLDYSSPIGDMFLVLFSFVCSGFGAMTVLWTHLAIINRGNFKITAFAGSIALLLAVVTFSFFWR
jgi:hypothetical protein